MRRLDSIWIDGFFNATDDLFAVEYINGYEHGWYAYVVSKETGEIVSPRLEGARGAVDFMNNNRQRILDGYFEMMFLGIK